MTTEEPVAPTDSSPQTKDGAPKNEQAAAQPASNGQEQPVANGIKKEDVDLPRRIYVGNISFQTTEEELKAHFEKFGAIKSTSIGRTGRRPGGRPTGYGFVVFEDEASCSKAIEEMHKTTFGERTISVQASRSKAESRARRQKHKASQQKEHKEDTKAKDGEEGTSGEASDEKEKKKTGKPRAPRPKRERGPPSSTIVYVGNLAFDLTDEEFKKAFTDAGLEVTSAYIARGRGRWSDRSKGFGFVTCTDEAQQQKAVQTMHGKELKERPMHVKVAFEKVTKSPTQGNGAEGDNTEKAEPGTGATEQSA